MNGTSNLNSYRKYFPLPPANPKAFPWNSYFTESEKSALTNILTSFGKQYTHGHDANNPELHWKLLNSIYEAIKHSPELNSYQGAKREFANHYNYTSNASLTSDLIGDFSTKFNHLIEGAVSQSSSAIIGDYESEAKAKVGFILYMVGLIEPG